MKKFLLIAMMVVATLSLSSCEDKDVVKYNVEITGDAEGDVSVTFPNGLLTLNGDADLAFHYGNATLGVTTITSEELATTKDKKVLKAAKEVNEDVVASFQATSAGGSYYLRIAGYAEIAGIRIPVEYILTNR